MAAPQMLLVGRGVLVLVVVGVEGWFVWGRRIGLGWGGLTKRPQGIWRLR